MSEIMETTNSAHHRRKDKFKFTSFPDYVRKVQQLSFSHANNIGDTEKAAPSGVKKQGLSRAFSCFATSTNSPSLPCKANDAGKPRLPPLHVGKKQQVKLKCCSRANTNSTDDSQLRPKPLDHLRGQELAIHRASSFPLVDSRADGKGTEKSPDAKPKRQAMNKSPYLQPLVHKTYYHKETPKGQRRKVKQQKLDTTTVETSGDKQCSKAEAAITNDSLIPSITLRAATPSGSCDETSMSLADQFTARKQLAAELDKLNREIQGIVVSVEQVE